MREDRVKIGPGTTSLTYRPMFEKWSCVLPIAYNANLISAEQIAQIFEYAGFHVGVGDWRPARNGEFGMFRVITNKK